jgi:hypothetical protein
MFKKATFRLQGPSAREITHAIQPNGDLVVMRSPLGLSHINVMLLRIGGLAFPTTKQLLMVQAFTELLVSRCPLIEIEYGPNANPLAKAVPWEDERQPDLFARPTT